MVCKKRQEHIVCKNCGYNNDDDSTFCYQCGAKLLNGQYEEQPLQHEYQNQQNYYQQPSTQLSTGIIQPIYYYPQQQHGYTHHNYFRACPRCGNTHFLYNQVVKKGENCGCLGIGLCIILFFIPIIGWIALGVLIHSLNKTTVSVYATCQNCGYSQNVGKCF